MMFAANRLKFVYSKQKENKIIVVTLVVLTFGLSGIFAKKVDKTCAINGRILRKSLCETPEEPCIEK